jgi:hypothetical protein
MSNPHSNFAGARNLTTLAILGWQVETSGSTCRHSIASLTITRSSPRRLHSTSWHSSPATFLSGLAVECCGHRRPAGRRSAHCEDLVALAGATFATSSHLKRLKVKTRAAKPARRRGAYRSISCGVHASTQAVHSVSACALPAVQEFGVRARISARFFCALHRFRWRSRQIASALFSISSAYTRVTRRLRAVYEVA